MKRRASVQRSYNPIAGAPGGVKRPPFTDDDPWRATAVPIRMCAAFTGSTAIAAIERFRATARLPGTSDQLFPKSTDLYNPTPASGLHGSPESRREVVTCV